MSGEKSGAATHLIRRVSGASHGIVLKFSKPATTEPVNPAPPDPLSFGSHDFLFNSEPELAPATLGAPSAVPIPVTVFDPLAKIEDSLSTWCFQNGR